MTQTSKKFNSKQDFDAALVAMSEYQRLHNVLRKDFMQLLIVTEKHLEDQEAFDSLYRASLRSLFSLIEADIHGLNQIDTYTSYQDEEDFAEKFKSTFKQIATTWDKRDIQRKYFDSKLQELKKLRIKRNELIHPKIVEHVYKADKVNFQILKKAFTDYDNFINAMMNGFFISIEIPTLSIM